MSTYLRIPFGEVYLSAQTSDSAFFDSYHLGPGGTIAKYDKNGNCIWAQHKFIAPIYINTNEVKLNFIYKDIIFYGGFRSTPFQIDTSSLTNKGSYDGFIARADSMGTIKWIYSFGNLGFDIIQSVSLDDLNNIYFTGGFKDSINLAGANVFNPTNDILLGKMDSNGNLIWIRQSFATGSMSTGSNITCNNFGQAYIIGTFSGSASFGTINISTINPYAMFLSRFDSSGNCLGVMNFGYADGGSLCVDNSGAPYCTGAFYNTITIGADTHTSYAASDIYVAKSDPLTGLNTLKKNDDYKLLIYANPNNGICTIELPAGTEGENNLMLKIYNANGKLIQKLPVNLGQAKIDLNIQAQARGTYNVVLENKNVHFFGKIIFE